MDNVGFCVFGRPSGHEYVANGLADKLNVGQSTYIRFENYKFSKGDSFAEISREYVNDTEVIKVLVYQFAESYDKRAGGFVGSGLVFRGIPSKKLLFSALIANHKIALELIDSATNRFKSQGFDKATLKKNLIGPSTEGLLMSGNPKKSQSKTINGEYGLKIEGSLFNHVMSAVQGFTMNPSFGGVKKLYVSSNSSLLVDRVGQGKVLSFAHLLDFTKYFNSYNDHLKKIESKYKTIEAEIDSKLNSEKTIIKSIEEKNRRKEKLENDLTSLEQRISAKTRELRLEEDKSNNLSKTISDKRSELSKTENKIDKLVQSKFNDAISKEPFKSQFERVTDNYRKTIKDKERELNEIKEGNEVSRKGVIIIFGIGLVLILLGMFIGSFFLSNLFGDDSSETIKEEIGKPQKEVVNQPKTQLKSFNSPTVYSTNAFLSLSEDTVQVHKARLDKFISQVEKADTSEYDLSNFFDRKWNFAEVIDYNKESLDQGLARLKRIKNIYKKNNRSVELFEKHYLIPNFAQFSTQKFDFKTSNRNEILNKYLEKPGNIYEGIDSGVESGLDYEKEMPLLYMHFRWIVFNISDYVDSGGNISKNGDILKTTKTQHNVPLK